MVKIETKLPDEKKPRKSGKKKNSKSSKRTVWLVLIILLIFAVAFGYWGYNTVMSPNVKTADEKAVNLFIPTGSDYDQVKALLAETNCIVNEKSFDWLAQKKDLPANVHPGHYVLKNGMTNNQLVNMLRGGLQTPVKVTFNNRRNAYLIPTSSIGTPMPKASSTVCFRNTTSFGTKSVSSKPNPKA